MKKILFILLMTARALGDDFEIVDEEAFGAIVPDGARVEKLAGDFQFTEGPVWIPRDGGYLVFSDIPANELKKWTPADGVSTFRSPSRHANGNILDREGRLITCEHGGRRVSILEKDGTLRTLVEDHDGKKFNSPNDAAVKSDGTVWFTDPDYGLQGRPRELDENYVFRYDPRSDETTIVADDFDKPNGLCFSPDEKRLYIADSGQPRHIRVFEVNDDGTLANGKVFCSIDNGAPDGIRADSEGRIYSSAGDGVQIFAKDGSLIGKILVPEATANLCFGGEYGKTVFMTARTSLYAIDLATRGAALSQSR